MSESNCVDEDYSYFSIEFISSRNLSWVWKGIGGSENVNVQELGSIDQHTVNACGSTTL